MNHQERFKAEMEVEYKFSRDVEDADLYATLYESIHHLPNDYARIIQMYLEGWKPEEIARQLGIALQTVYNRRHEAIGMLLKIIKDSKQRSRMN